MRPKEVLEPMLIFFMLTAVQLVNILYAVGQHEKIVLFSAPGGLNTIWEQIDKA